MTIRPLWREKFSRDRDFEVIKPFLYFGRWQTVGHPFDKSRATTRKLRQLVANRKIRMVPLDDVPSVSSSNTPPPSSDEWLSYPWMKMKKHVKDKTGRVPKNKPDAIEIMATHNG